ncbi:putative RNA polymerase sigma factor FecI [Pandoraea anapnoica]|uniref:Putative RNA polymerase sigma factor FecI n=1 Tax=Pandoraea anapnoica TaxID=2508301 RepID=A0A5E5ANG8_9BURK|nr:RNA polymerase sigma factor [Pandoraea anapnoica]VVE75259.1 putative RNA polymerase sigma factor FecI [Pandoraea anapnoica]
MAENAPPLLLDYLTTRYHNLKLRLRKVLGDDELADDALHDTWLRLKKQEDEASGTIQSPASYLVRMAVNLAVDARRKHGRTVSGSEIDELLDEIADASPGPLQVTESRADLASLMDVLNRMPERRRQIVVMVRWNGMTQREAAQALGVSLRTVESDLQRANDYLNAYMSARENDERF